jgi:hypothetical protein
MQLARKRDAVPVVRDYITDVQRRYREKELALHRASGSDPGASQVRTCQGFPAGA